MKKSKFTYQNEITITLDELPRIYFGMLGLITNQQICDYCTRLFIKHVNVPKNSAFGGKITNETERIIEVSIYEIGEKYAGRIIHIHPVLSI